jgi:hypothetical protein
MPTMPYTANINSTTGIAYGYISARALDSDLVDELMNNGTDTYAEEAFNEWRATKADMLLDTDESIESLEDAMMEADNLSYEFWDKYEAYEPSIEGVHDGVKYCSSWLGGALNFFISESPVTTTKARLASPCVPNAGILDTLDGNVVSYDVPADWRRTED